MDTYYTDTVGNTVGEGVRLYITGGDNDTGPLMSEEEADQIKNNLTDEVSEVIFEDFKYVNCGALYNYKYNITSVDMFNSNIKYIAPDAFRGDGGLQYVSFPDTLEVINEGAFENCYALRNTSGELRLPQKLYEIGLHAFDHCYALTKIIVPLECHVAGEKNGYLEIGEMLTNIAGSNAIAPAPVYIQVERY